MNFDDSQLSAFLDEELDADDHMMVAWNVESSSLVAQQLTDLRSVQTAVAGLDRPAIPFDLSAAVVTELNRINHRRRLVTRVGRLAASVVGVGSLAASLMLALFVLHRSLHDDTMPRLFSFQRAAAPRNDLHPHLAPVLNSAATPPASLPGASQLAQVSPAVRFKTSLASAAASPANPSPPETAGVDGPEPARPGQVDAMLGHRKVLRALIVTDVLNQTSRQVRSLIEQDASRDPEFGQITLAQGIVIDPDHPGEAEIYSVVMNESTSLTFLEQIRREFPQVQIEAEPTPATVTHLSEVGQVAVFSGVRPARLGLPPGEITSLVAAKDAQVPDHFPHQLLDPLQPGRFPADHLDKALERPSVPPGIARQQGQARTSVAPGDKSKLHSLTLAAEPDAEPVTVLVWVTRSPRR